MQYKFHQPLTTDVCNNYDSWTLTTTSATKTPEETKIQDEIKSELTKICTGYSSAITEQNNSAPVTNTNSTTYTNAQTTRENTIKAINEETQKYNLKIIDIKSKEFAVKSRTLSLQHAQDAYKTAKETFQKTTNSLEIIDKKIS